MLGWVIVVLLAPSQPAGAEAPASEGPFVPVGGASPFEHTSPGPQRPDAAGLPVEGRAPIRSHDDGDAPAIARPFGDEANTTPSEPDPRRTNIARFHVMAGLTGRIHPVDPALSASVEYGRIQGLSGSFHTSFIPATTARNFFFETSSVVRALDVPIGLGALWRGKLKHRPIFGSIGLTAGILVHRAKFQGQVIHRVDPDFRIPLRFSWRPARVVGLSAALVPGYSVRNRAYEKGGSVIWTRNAFRITALVGLHFDLRQRGRKQ